MIKYIKYRRFEKIGNFSVVSTEFIINDGVMRYMNAINICHYNEHNFFIWTSRFIQDFYSSGNLGSHRITAPVKGI